MNHFAASVAVQATSYLTALLKQLWTLFATIMVAIETNMEAMLSNGFKKDGENEPFRQCCE